MVSSLPWLVQDNSDDEFEDQMAVGCHWACCQSLHPSAFGLLCIVIGPHSPGYPLLEVSSSLFAAADKNHKKKTPLNQISSCIVRSDKSNEICIYSSNIFVSLPLLIFAPTKFYFIKKKHKKVQELHWIHSRTNQKLPLNTCRYIDLT